MNKKLKRMNNLMNRYKVEEKDLNYKKSVNLLLMNNQINQVLESQRSPSGLESTDRSLWPDVQVCLKATKPKPKTEDKYKSFATLGGKIKYWHEDLSN